MFRYEKLAQEGMESFEIDVNRSQIDFINLLLRKIGLASHHCRAK